MVARKDSRDGEQIGSRAAARIRARRPLNQLLTLWACGRPLGVQSFSAREADSLSVAAMLGALGAALVLVPVDAGPASSLGVQDGIVICGRHA
jgi:hypothetical protein